MYNQPFYIPRYYGNVMPFMMRGAMGGNSAIRGGLFSRIASSLGNIKNFNWSGLINNTSKTLGIINQTIPIVKQVKPVINNVRSMMKIASIFKDETDDSYKKKSFNDINNSAANVSSDSASNNNYHFDGSPTFFI